VPAPEVSFEHVVGQGHVQKTSTIQLYRNNKERASSDMVAELRCPTTPLLEAALIGRLTLVLAGSLDCRLILTGNCCECHISLHPFLRLVILYGNRLQARKRTRNNRRLRLRR
jgi:hypothetical protein